MWNLSDVRRMRVIVDPFVPPKVDGQSPAIPGKTEWNWWWLLDLGLWNVKHSFSIWPRIQQYQYYLQVDIIDQIPPIIRHNLAGNYCGYMVVSKYRRPPKSSSLLSTKQSYRSTISQTKKTLDQPLSPFRSTNINHYPLDITLQIAPSQPARYSQIMYLHDVTISHPDVKNLCQKSVSCWPNQPHPCALASTAGHKRRCPVCTSQITCPAWLGYRGTNQGPWNCQFFPWFFMAAMAEQWFVNGSSMVR